MNIKYFTVIGIGGLLLIATLGVSFREKILPTVSSAPAGTNVQGHIWSSNVGWTKLTGPNYGLQFNFSDTSGDGLYNYADLSNNSWAWNSNIGWINFNPTSGFPSVPAHGVRYVNGNLEGWARATANGGGWDGWIKFGGSQYSATRNGCSFEGYAWGGDVIGWIKLNGANYGFNLNPSTGCETVDIDDFSADPNPVKTDAGTTLSWTPAGEVNGFEVVSDWLGGPPAGTILPGGDPAIRVTPPDLNGGITTYDLRTINKFGDRGPVETVDVTVDYEVSGTCTLPANLNTIDTDRAFDLTFQGLYGSPENSYTFELLEDGLAGIRDIEADQDLTQSPAGDTFTWTGVRVLDGDIGQIEVRVQVKDESGDEKIISCGQTTNFGDRTIIEATP